MKKKLAIAFALGLLVGILFLSGGDDPSDADKQAAKNPLAHDVQPRHAPDPPRFGSNAPRQETAPWEQNRTPGYGMSQGGYGTNPATSGGTPQWGGSSGPGYSEQPPAYRGYDASPAYGYPTQPAAPEPQWGTPGYRFRPQKDQPSSRNRYSGEYPKTAPVFAPRADSRQEQPPYPQQQPSQWGSPGYDDRLPYSQNPPSDLYSIR